MLLNIYNKAWAVLGSRKSELRHLIKDAENNCNYLEVYGSFMSELISLADFYPSLFEKHSKLSILNK